MDVLKWRVRCLIGVFIYLFMSLYPPIFACFEGVFKAYNVHFYRLLVLGILGSKMSKNQPKEIKMSRHAVDLSSFQPMG